VLCRRRRYRATSKRRRAPRCRCSPSSFVSTKPASSDGKSMRCLALSAGCTIPDCTNALRHSGQRPTRAANRSRHLGRSKG
jgi:hypothetical protein